MMRHAMKRILALVMSLTLLTVPALAQEESSVAALLKQVHALAFETSNVTAKVSATFTWDGEMFKSGTVERRQAGTDASTDVSLTTYKDGKESYVGEYTTHEQASYAYTVSSYNDNAYYTSTREKIRGTLMYAGTLREALFSLAGTAASTLDLGIKATVDGSETTYTLAEGAMPELVNAGLSYILSSELNRRGYPMDGGNYGSQVFYEDNAATARGWFTKNTELSAEEIDKILNGNEDGVEDEKVWALFDQYSTDLNAVVDAASIEAQTHGMQYPIICVRADGSTEAFASINDYLRAVDEVQINYANFSKAMMMYHNTIAAEQLKDYEFVNMINELDGDGYMALSTATDAYYTEEIRKLDPKAVAARIAEDGTITIVENAAYLYSDGFTMKDQIFNAFTTGTVKTLNMTTTVDDAGNLTSAKGDVSFSITDREGAVHELTITFDAIASDFGTTTVTPFDTEGSIPSFEEFIGN